VEPEVGDVKERRGYDASNRRARAQERRLLVLRVAEEMFLRDGYGGVTVRAVAEATGTSIETIYKTYGGKAGLVAAIQEAALEGSGPVPAPDRSDAMSAREPDADLMLGHWAELSKEVAPRVSPIMLLVRSAAVSDPQMAALQQQMAAQRRERMTHNAARLLATGEVRPQLTHDQVRDVLYTYTAPELFEIVVLEGGWTLQQYAEFLHRGLRGQLLASADASGPDQPVRGMGE
jgi:AcrR family transcriptional regulator